MVQSVREAEKSIGEISYQLTEKQVAGKAFSRSLYIAEDIKEGELFTDKNIKSVRPGFGMHPKFYSKIIGKEAKKNFKKVKELNKKRILVITVSLGLPRKDSLVNVGLDNAWP